MHTYERDVERPEMPKCQFLETLDWGSMYAESKPGGLVSDMGRGPAEAAGMLTLLRQKLQYKMLVRRATLWIGAGNKCELILWTLGNQHCYQTFPGTGKETSISKGKSQERDPSLVSLACLNKPPAVGSHTFPTQWICNWVNNSEVFVLSHASNSWSEGAWEGQEGFLCSLKE